MRLTQLAITNIYLAIHFYIREMKPLIDPRTGMIRFFLPPLAYTPSAHEIRAAERRLAERNTDVCFVKHNYTGEIRIYFCKHKLGNFSIGIDSNDRVITIHQEL